MSKTYENGRQHSKFDDNGNGFIYYPSGLVAVCISEASPYQKRFFAFDSNRKNTNLLIIDEYGVGSCSAAHRKKFRCNNCDFSLAKVGGLINDADGHITHQWKWDPKAQDAGVPPAGELVFQLNECLTFKFNCSRKYMTLIFQCESFLKELDLGVKLKRDDTYLDHAHKGLAGRLIPQFEHQTLSQRHDSFADEMAAQRNKLNPRSENLSEMVRDIVSKLEADFDDINDTMKISQGIGTAWKKEALDKTLSEIPRIANTGMETGVNPGFSTTIYKGLNDLLESTVPLNLQTTSGQWKGSVEVRSTLREENPPLPRTAVLSNSGRYSSLIVVDKDSVSANNPTGMIEMQGLPLVNHRWSELKHELAGTVSNTSPLTVAIVLRGGDPKGQQWLRVTELVNMELSKLRDSPELAAASDVPEILKSNPPHLIKIDISESNALITELGIKSTPTFLMFHGRSLMYAGAIGGRKVKVSTTHKPQVLLIEPNFRQQVPAEKTLRKLGCDAFLCSSLPEALNRIQQMTRPSADSSGHVSGAVTFDLVLISEDVGVDNIMNLKKALLDVTGNKRTIVAMLVNVLGERGKSNLKAVKWKNSYTDDVNAFNVPAVASVCTAAIQNPVKANSIEKLLSMTVVAPNDTNFGLTETTMKQKIAKVQDDVKNGRCAPISYVGIRLSAEDTIMRGSSLIASKK